LPLDPDSQYGSGSIKSLSPDPIRTRIHNPAGKARRRKPNLEISGEKGGSHEQGSSKVEQPTAGSIHCHNKNTVLDTQKIKLITGKYLYSVY
jgi:hypothetical protein